VNEHHFIQSAVLCLLMLLTVDGCSKEKGSSGVPVAIQVGGLYTTQEKDGTWRVMKVLTVDEHAVHLRSYANKFREQPKEVDPASLTLGGLNDPAGFGIGHFPLAKEGFWKDSPVLIKVEPVREDELEGYKLYLEAMNEGDPTPR
jgi:hypothetical protein